jgi:hypothetical protein
MQRFKLLVRTLFIFILLAGLVAGILSSSLESVHASPHRQSACNSPMAQWTFDQAGLSPTNPQPNLSNVIASASENGVDNLGFTPTGSYSGNAWSGSSWPTNTTLGPYFEFDVSSVGYTDLSMSFYASSSNTGPKTVYVQYDTGTSIAETGPYAVPLSPMPSQISIPFSSALDNKANVKFLIYGANSGTGTLRIDNVVFTGCQPSDLTATASSDNLTGTAAVNLTDTAASNLTATASSANLTAIANSNLTSTAASNQTLTAIANNGCSSSTFSTRSLLINEVGWMGTKYSPNDEWIEFYNTGSSCVNLSGWILKIVDSNIKISLSGTVAAGGYFVLADNNQVFHYSDGSAFIFGEINSSLSLWNDGEALILIGPDGYTQVDSANWWDGYWPAGIAASSNSNLAYSSMERIGDVPDSPSAWVTYANSTTSNILDHGNNPVHGTPGRQNWASTVTETPSPAPTATKKPIPTAAPTPVPAVVLNEILARPGSDWNSDGVVNNNDEFIEVENLGPGIATLTNWRLTVTPNNGSGTFYLPSLKLNPNERAVFYGATTHLMLEDSGETVSLTDSHGVIEDAFTYPAVLQPDDSWCRIRDGIGPWRDGCFPTPGFENTISGVLPTPPAPQPGGAAACLLPDVAPNEFRLAECNGVGVDIWNQGYWNNLSGQNEYPVLDPNNKWETFIQ